MTRRIFRFLQVCWLAASRPSLTVDFSWNTADEAELRAFLAKPAGAKLAAQLQRSIADQNDWASDQTRDCVHAAGYALGWKSCARMVISILRVSASRAADEDLTHGVASDAGTKPDADTGRPSELEQRYCP